MMNLYRTLDSVIKLDVGRIYLNTTHLVQSDNVGMLDQLHKSDLLHHLGPGALIQLHLVNHLHCHLLPGEDMLGQLDHGIVTLANSLSQVIQTSYHVLGLTHLLTCVFHSIHSCVRLFIRYWHHLGLFLLRLHHVACYLLLRGSDI